MNAKQILAQYQIKEKMKKETSLTFRQFPELTGKNVVNDLIYFCYLVFKRYETLTLGCYVYTMPHEKCESVTLTVEV